MRSSSASLGGAEAHEHDLRDEHVDLHADLREPHEGHEARLRLHAPPSNRAIVDKLREVGELLEQQGASAQRVDDYQSAASAIDALGEPLAARLDGEGRKAVEALGLPPSLVSGIDELLRTGRLAILERLQGASMPERVFCAIPGVGPTLARRIHDRLHIDTLEGLELAAYDGTLEAVAGMGPRRVRALQGTLAALLGRARQAPDVPAEVEAPIATLLDVDAEYRRRAERGDLARIAPKRFNPDGRAWLPILHTERGGWQLTAMFANTARANQLGKTHDWVLLYFHDATHSERQRTIVTESRGMLSGFRVVRGREEECGRLHAHTPLARPFVR